MPKTPKVNGSCACGFTPPEFNEDCERCHLTLFVRRVSAMRRAQKRYFKERGHTNLIDSKELEQKIDGLIEEMTNPGLF